MYIFTYLFEQQDKPVTILAKSKDLAAEHMPQVLFERLSLPDQHSIELEINSHDRLDVLQYISQNWKAQCQGCIAVQLDDVVGKEGTSEIPNYLIPLS